MFQIDSPDLKGAGHQCYTQQSEHDALVLNWSIFSFNSHAFCSETMENTLKNLRKTPPLGYQRHSLFSCLTLIQNLQWSWSLIS